MERTLPATPLVSKLLPTARRSAPGASRAGQVVIRMTKYLEFVTAEDMEGMEDNPMAAPFLARHQERKPGEIPIAGKWKEFEQMWVTRENYEESGSQIVHRMCF